MNQRLHLLLAPGFSRVWGAARLHWINEKGLIPGKFGWQRGYGAFSISHSGVEKVSAYIANQEGHHKKRSFAEEFKILVEKYELQWHDEGNP